MNDGNPNNEDKDAAGIEGKTIGVQGVPVSVPVFVPEALPTALNNATGADGVQQQTTQNCDPPAGTAITESSANSKGSPEAENNENTTGSASGTDASRPNPGAGVDSGGSNRFEWAVPRTSAPNSMWSVGSVACRICHTSEHPERLISPCLCKGTLAYVHKGCLENWLGTSGMINCELCHYRFHTEQSLRYTFIQSLRLWYKHPNNRGLLQADFLVCSLLTVVSFGLIGICMLGLQYFVVQGKRLGISKLWTQGSIIVFLIIVAFVYCVNLFLILKSQLVPWYRWWQSARRVRLILIDRRPLKLRKKTKPAGAVLDETELRSTVLSHTISQHASENNTTITVPAPRPMPV